MQATASTSQPGASYFHSLSLEDVVDDLSSRFLVNLPDEELESIERVCFQIEQAHWYYEDFVRPQAAHLPSFSLRSFSQILFKTNPLLSHFDAEKAYDQFIHYKTRVPVCGAILLSENRQKCLVVKGWKSGAAWSFPRGKINQGETERDCAVREVWEETGYDISPHFHPDLNYHAVDSDRPPPLLPQYDYPEDDYLECLMQQQRVRLYVIPGVSEDTLFETKTRKEISAIAWTPLTNLPTWTGRKSDKKDLKCYMVAPFVNRLKSWLASHKGSAKSRARRKNRQKNLAEEGLAEADIQAVTSDNEGADELLSAQSEALQQFFFGHDLAMNTDTNDAFEPTTAPARRLEEQSPILDQEVTVTSSNGHRHQTAMPVPSLRDQHGKLQAEQSNLMTSQAGLLSILQGNRSPPDMNKSQPLAQSPSDQLLSILQGKQRQPDAGSSPFTQPAQNPLLALLHGRSLNNGGPQSQPHIPSPVQTPSQSAFSSTVQHSTPRQLAFSDVVPSKPSSAASPQFTVGRTAESPVYDEEKRQQTRSQLLDMLTLQLGAPPTPPSQNSTTDGDDSIDEEGPDDGRPRSPARDLLRLMQLQSNNRGR